MPFNTDHQVSAAQHRIQTGDIFLVQDTCPSCIGEWQALKFDKKRGHWDPHCQSIPESAQ
jgi:ssDNA-binding Zn-finger/Zn-ribbon topoisomerase 1